MAEESKLNTAWERLFQKYPILESIENKGTFAISAEQIKEYREPRLMTKFDWSDSRPELFKEHGLSVLPDSRGSYVIGKFKAYKSLNYEEIKPISVRKPDWVRSFDNFDITSESVALNLAQMTGMIDRVMELDKETPSAVSTITGRLKSGILDYDIDIQGASPYNFKVQNSQIEIDAGFESKERLAIIEAKNRIPKDFMIRQLYYPYIGYNNLQTGKPIMPIYFTHADDVYGFHIFKFEDVGNYSSIKKVRQVNFIIDESLAVSIENVRQISQDSPNETEPENVPFPQADNITRILDMIQHLGEPKNKWELAKDYEFDVRQSDYYANALIYLGFVDKERGCFKLNRLGREIALMSNSDSRNKIIISQILKHKSFNVVMEHTLRNLGKIDSQFIQETLLKYVPTIKSTVTAHRRSSTVKHWINWVLNVAVRA